jgi:hypothetical protein
MKKAKTFKHQPIVRFGWRNAPVDDVKLKGRIPKRPNSFEAYLVVLDENCDEKEVVKGLTEVWKNRIWKWWFNERRDEIEKQYLLAVAYGLTH